MAANSPLGPRFARENAPDSGESYRGAASSPRIEKTRSPGGDGEKKSMMPPVSAVEGRGPGRKANVEANCSIGRVVEYFGNNWRGRLAEVCEALDRSEEHTSELQ